METALPMFACRAVWVITSQQLRAFRALKVGVFSVPTLRLVSGATTVTFCRVRPASNAKALSRPAANA